MGYEIRILKEVTMFTYKKLEDACLMMLTRDVELAGYSKMKEENYKEDGSLKEDKDLRLNYDGEVIRIFDDGVQLFGVHNGWVFSYWTWFKKDKNMKRYVKSEVRRIVEAYNTQVKDDNKHIKEKYQK